MKKYFIILMFGLTGLVPCYSQTNQRFVGDWLGTLNVGIELRIVVHIKSQPDGAISSTLDSPDQSAFGIAADTSTIHDNEFHFAISNLHASFTGTLQGDSVIAGNFSQGKDLPLTLRKTSGPVTMPKRPQTPQPPFPYTSEDVEYENSDHSIHFGGTLTFPQQGGTFVTAVLITGSGQQDRDETILNHKPFAVIADYLTRHGFAVLRVDDRQVGKTTGDALNASSEDFAKDVMTAMDYLKTRKEVDPKKIGLIGHSEGGLIASLVLMQRKDVAFVISLAGAGMKGADILADQGEVIMIKEGVAEHAAKSYHGLYRRIIQYSLEEKDSAQCFNKVWKDYTAWKVDMPAEELKELGFADDSAAQKVFAGLVGQLYLPWLQYFNASDASLNYRKAYCPVLALNGSEDVQVIASKNLPGIEAGLKKSRSKNYEIKELPGLDHLFQHCKKCTPSEYGQIEETFSPEVLQIMTDWLQKAVQ